MEEHDHDLLPTVEDRLTGSLARQVALRDLALIRAHADRPDWRGVELFTEDTIRDLRAIEAALERTVWGRASLGTVAPSVPGERGAK